MSDDTNSPHIPLVPFVDEANKMIILGEVVGCSTCISYIDGLVHAPSDGFCPQCGTHMKTRKDGQKKKEELEKILRGYEVLRDE